MSSTRHFYWLEWRVHSWFANIRVDIYKIHNEIRMFHILCREEMEINCDDVVIQSSVTFHFQRNVLRTHGTNVRENSLGRHINLVYTRFMAHSIYLLLFIITYPPHVSFEILTNETWCIRIATPNSVEPIPYWKIPHEHERTCSVS